MDELMVLLLMMVAMLTFGMLVNRLRTGLTRVAGR
jgi:hypothetical protein